MVTVVEQRYDFGGCVELMMMMVMVMTWLVRAQCRLLNILRTSLSTLRVQCLLSEVNCGANLSL